MKIGAGSGFSSVVQLVYGSVERGSCQIVEREWERGRERRGHPPWSLRLSISNPPSLEAPAKEAFHRSTGRLAAGRTRTLHAEISTKKNPKHFLFRAWVKRRNERQGRDMATTTCTRFTDEYQLYEELGKWVSAVVSVELCPVWVASLRWGWLLSVRRAGFQAVQS